jgi:hypothetical protein
MPLRQAAQACSNGRFRTLVESFFIEYVASLFITAPTPSQLDNALQRQRALYSLGFESSGNDTASSLRFQSSTFRRIIFTFDNKYFHISTIGQRFSPKTIDRVPEVQGLLFAPCTVGPYGLPRRPPIYSQRSAPCLFIRHGPQYNTNTINERIKFWVDWSTHRSCRQVSMASIWLLALGACCGCGWLLTFSKRG